MAVRIVLDTNVLVSAMRSRRGASHRLLRLIDGELFGIGLSVPLYLEYREVCTSLIGQIDLSEEDIDTVLDYVCRVAQRQPIYYLWRPFLPDPKDDMVLELAVAADCQRIVTFNLRDFRGVEQFGIRALTPRAFLQELGELP